MWKKSAFNVQYLRKNYAEIITRRLSMLWARFPEAALLNLVHLVYQGIFLWQANIEKDVDTDWFFWTARLLSLIFVAVAAELLCERNGGWQSGKERWKIWSMLLGWGIILAVSTKILPEAETAMFLVVNPCFWLCLIIYLLLPEKREKQSARLRCCVNTFITAGVTGGLLSVLLGICLAAVQALLLPVPTELKIFLLGVLPFACAVSVLLCLLAESDDGAAEPVVNNSVMGLVFPWYVFLLLILYLYIGKIIIKQAMPVGEMNWYASLAMLGYGFFYFFWNDIRKAWFDKFMRWGLVLFLPILMVQFYGIWIRYNAYGLTSLRYASMICTACGVLMLAFRFLRQGIRSLFLLGAVLILVFSISPLNIMRVPLHEQQARLITLLEQEGLYENSRIVMSHPISAKRTPAIKSCVEYIRNSNLTGDGREDFYRQVDEINWRRYYFNERNPNAGSEDGTAPTRVEFKTRQKGIPVAGFRMVYPFTVKRGMAVIQMEDGKRQSVDIHAYAKELMSAHKNDTDPQNELWNKEYRLEDKSCLYFTELTVQQSGKSEEPVISGRGYFLQK